MRYIKNNLKELDPNLTIGEYLKQEEGRLKELEEKRLLERSSFIDDLKGKYIKIVDEDYMGVSSLYVKVKDVVFESYTEDLKQLFNIEGKMYSFSKYMINNNRKSFSVVMGDDSFEFISEQGFSYAEKEYKKIQNILKEVIY